MAACNKENKKYNKPFAPVSQLLL